MILSASIHVMKVMSRRVITTVIARRLPRVWLSSPRRLEGKKRRRHASPAFAGKWNYKCFKASATSSSGVVCPLQALFTASSKFLLWTPGLAAAIFCIAWLMIASSSSVKPLVLSCVHLRPRFGWFVMLFPMPLMSRGADE